MFRKIPFWLLVVCMLVIAGVQSVGAREIHVSVTARGLRASGTADDPLSSIVLGAGMVLDNEQLLHTVTVQY